MLSFLHPAVIVDVLFRSLGNFGHCLNSFHRICSCCSFTGKHNCRCSVIDCIGNVCCLRPGWSWIFYHGFQHLCRCDYMLSLCLRHFDHLLLYYRYFFHRNFYTQITSCNHNAIRYCKNILQIAYPLHTFNFSNNLHMAAMLIKYFPDFQNIFPTSYKRSCYEIKSHITAEHDITSVHITDIWHGQFRAGNINSLMIGNGSSIYYCTYYIGFFYCIHNHFNQTIVN